ncbi:hypothetical protein CMK18_06925 [Candidatus Poribacteria bacterium]|nr:hypothetical protein [Candidatus Poribacteria bacterium]
MKRKENFNNFYLRTPDNLAQHLISSAKSWGMSKNGYLNKLLRDDMEIKANKNITFVEDTYLKQLQIQNK